MSKNAYFPPAPLETSLPGPWPTKTPQALPAVYHEFEEDTGNKGWKYFPVIFTCRYLSCSEKWNIANSGLVGREQERWSGSLAQQFPLCHTPITLFVFRAGDVWQNCRESVTQLQNENSGSQKKLLSYNMLPTWWNIDTSDCNLEVLSSAKNCDQLIRHITSILACVCKQSPSQSWFHTLVESSSENQMSLHATYSLMYF